MSSITGDFRPALRMLRKSPGFAAAAALTLALGIGANSAIFSVINVVLLRPLPYPGAARLVTLWETRSTNPDDSVNPKRTAARKNSFPVNTTFDRWNQQSQSFETMAGYIWYSMSLTGSGEPERLRGAAVSPGFFSLVGTQPPVGRAFSPDDNRVGNDLVAILAHGLWMRRFGGASGIVGSKILLDGKPHTVIGIMPAGFAVELPGIGADTDLFVPLAHTLSGRANVGLCMIGARLKPGVSAAQAQEEISAIARAMDTPRRYRLTGGNVVGMTQEISQTIRPALLVLLGAAGCVLLIACANLANLLLARAMGQQRELGIRAVLGAGRWDLARKSLAESLTLALAGGALGVLLARWGVALLLAAAPKGLIPRSGEIGADLRVLAFGLAVSVLAGLAIGLVPAWQAVRRQSQGQLSEALKEGGRSSAGTGGRRIRSALVVAETAVALAVLAGAGLLIRSFVRLTGVDPGFRPEHVLSVQVNLPATRYKDPVSQADFADRVLERVQALPSVQAAAITNSVPMSAGTVWSGRVLIEGRSNEVPAAFRTATADYFRVMGITLRKGRLFTAEDAARDTLIVNQAVVRRYWPDVRDDSPEPLGRRIQVEKKWREIVGVISDIKHDGLAEDTSPELYLPFRADPATAMALVVRAAGDPMSLVPAIRAAVWSVDKDQPLEYIETLEHAVYTSVAAPRFRVALLGIFAALALALAAVGIYGVMAYAVTQRTHEIGIRMALGAGRPDVLRMVVREGLVLAAIGVAVGLAAAVAATRVLATFLFGISPTDGWTLAGASLLLLAVAALASYVPARRATRVDPMVALRWE